MLQKFKQPPNGYTEFYAWGDDEFGQLGVSGKKNSHKKLKKNSLNKRKLKAKTIVIPDAVVSI